MHPARRYFDWAFGRYALTSVLATGSDFSLAYALHRAGAPPAVATFFGCALGGLVAFIVSRGWAFRARHGGALPQLLRFLGVWAASAALNSFGVQALAFLPFVLAWSVVRGAVYLGWNYPMSRWFVFGTAKPQAAQSSHPAEGREAEAASEGTLSET